ncbi:glycoside hydrolase [Trametes gibbosa]|nr:glycoside hydrolase [Trametes gibbosa]
MRLAEIPALIILGALASFVGQVNADLKGVFGHYLIGSLGGASEAVKDVQDAKKMGLDAFALNVQDATAPFATNAIQLLFSAAEANGFKLFFSFDMTTLTDPSTFIPLLLQYQTSPAYYFHESRPFVSTFDGGNVAFGKSTPNEGWQIQFKDVLANSGVNPFFVPDFDDFNHQLGGTYDVQFFQDFTVLDGVFSWESAWPEVPEGHVNVSSAKDKTGLTNAHAAGKVYMMPLSSFQFKHIDANQNFYRLGGLNLAQRIGQVLELQPDFVEIITWNDSGESHFVGNIFPEPIAGSPAIQAYADGFDHTAWQNVLAPFIVAYKNSKTSAADVVPFGAFAGAFWYRPLLLTAQCPNDSLGKPDGAQNAVDELSFAVLLPADSSGVTVRVLSGGTVTATLPTTPGLNAATVPIRLGSQRVELVAADGNIIGAGVGTKDVVGETDGVCNFNYEVANIS